MTNRWLRLLLVVLALGATVGLGYRAWLNVQAQVDGLAAARVHAGTAGRALRVTGDLRATLHAYVAPGQGQAFWTARVFNEMRDLLRAIENELIGVAAAIESAAAERHAELSREQSLLAASAAALWLVVALLLVPVPRQGAGQTPDAPGHPVVADTPERTAPEPLVTPGLDLVTAAAVCGDLARLADGTAIGSLLERAASVLGASGVIVWVTGDDRSALYPVASFGYDERLVARVGSIPERADNITAQAFRAADLRASRAAGAAPAALAVPLVGPAGAVGVLSAEVPGVATIEAPRAALARIFAAQLATLVASLPPTAAAEAPVDTTETPPRQAQQV